MKRHDISGHWTEDELIERLYELREADAHLESCRECRWRSIELKQRRAAMTAPAAIPGGLMEAQRRAILGSMEKRSNRAMKWAPALAAACLLVVGAYLYRPVRAPQPRPESSDAQLLADIYSIEETAEPRAAEPIHALFEDGQ